MRFRLLLASIVMTVASLGAEAFEAPAGIGVASTKHGDVLTDSHGMTLYTFDQDSPGQSACMEKCAKQWPPMAAAADAVAGGDFTVIDRADGSRQWCYKSMPLYGWFRDKDPGDVTGHGFRGVWHVAKP